MPDWVEVGGYAGGRGDETPRVVLLGGREVTLRIERCWLEEPVGSSGSERRRMFKVQLEDGRRGVGIDHRRGGPLPRSLANPARVLVGSAGGGLPARDSSATLAEQHRKELGGQADQARVARDGHPKNGRWQRRAARWERPATRPARA